MPANKPLTKADTVALWHAVDAYTAQVKILRTLPDVPPAELAVEQQRVQQAKQALRKVNALRKQAL